MEPSVSVLDLLAGKWVSQAISVAAELSIADELAAGPRAVEDLAAACGAHPDSLHRLLRALASVGVFAEDTAGRFANTGMSESLRSDVPGSMRSMALMFGGRPAWDAWGELRESIRTGESAFKAVNGAHAFDYMKGDPKFGRIFGEAMTAFSAQELSAIHAAFDFSQVPTLVDVAGGHGAFLLSVLERNPDQRGILFDQPDVIRHAQAALDSSPAATRCSLVSGDFFVEVPAGDGYVLKHILHDWRDDLAIKILSTIQRAARPGARLFVIDAVVEPGNTAGFAKLLDLEMLVFYDGGRERTLAAVEKLFAATGFRLLRVVPTHSLMNVIEAERL
ncbi:methyltransferase [Mycobacterium asiaticum]|nr:methyltransferase [Mycobacterium asiaticum]